MSLDRRSLLGSAAAAAWLAGGTRAAHAADLASVLVAGPESGRMAGWLTQLTPGLLAGLAEGRQLTRQNEGGADGVTGANVFEARFTPTGTGLLLAPGAAAQAWLAGDSRVHFDVGRWLPVLAGVSTGALVCRRGLATAAAQPLRVAVADCLEPAATMLLGLELLGVPAEPVSIGAEPLRALAAGHIDAAFIPGADAAAQIGNAAAVFSFGRADSEDLGVPDPLLPDMPTLGAQIVASGGADGVMLTAWRAAAAAALLDFALVLQTLTAASEVTVWRQAGMAAQASVAGQTRLVAAPGCNALLARIAADGPQLLAYRGWLTRRLGWQPG